ncbi:MAG: adenylyltransferase [Spirochaetae bacterium HGW-Spirochaetae-1]|jgi:adenylyltransferase/sulfurtransferase|nr:MAG: adenylyltransferase [Spirochaetae bacterium HGW-Spirochaetae-1]
MLTDNELNRYKRQMGINTWGRDGQEKLKSSKVFVAGTGGLGGPVLYYLASAGIGRLCFCDYDIIDISNLNRQILHKTDRLGLYKTESAFQTLHDINPEIELIPLQKKITTGNVHSLVGEADIIVDCLDNFNTRQILNRFAVENNIPLVHGGIAEFQGQLTFISPPETACLACFLPEKDDKKKPNVIGATAGIVGSMQALEVIKYITGHGTLLKNKLLFWDGLDSSIETMQLTKNPRCKVCG